MAVVIEGDRVLLIKRYLRRDSPSECVMCPEGTRDGGTCPGHHYAVLPGGHVDDGETAEQAARRELLEETTLHARVDRQLWSGHHNGRPASYFLMTDLTGRATMAGSELDESSRDNQYELRWATAEEFDALRLHPRELRAPLTDLLASDRG